MSDTEARLRAALHDIADSDAPAARQVDVAAFRRRRTRLVGTGIAVVVVAAAGAIGMGIGVGGGSEPRENRAATRPSVSAQPGDNMLPRLLTVRCGAGGTSEVSANRIAASADGVHIELDRGTASAQDGFTYTPGSGQGSGMSLPEVPTTYVFDIAPGEVFVSCHDATTDDQQTISIAVLDPDDYYQEVDAANVLGCHFTGYADGPTTEGATGQAAAQAWVDTYAPDGTLTPAEGYVDDPERYFLLDSSSERAEIQIFATDDGTFTAGLNGVCFSGP